MPLPIKSSEYGHCIEQLSSLDIGDALSKDCKVEELTRAYPTLRCLEGCKVNIDELDYLAKRLDGFDAVEVSQFQAIQTWLMGSCDCGVFTHREIAQRLMDTFTGLKIKELAWFENPREKTLKNGKPRARRAKWLPDREVDLVYLYSDRYLDARNPSPAETDFFTVTRMDAWGVSTWFMCTPEAAEKLIAMNYDNLTVKETTIVG